MKMSDFDITMTQYNRGDIITGTIVMIGESEVVVALGGLKEGVFKKEELPAAFKLGDAILVMVTGEIDDKGCLVVTHAGVNKALEEKQRLNDLKVGSEFDFVVSEIGTAGFAGEFSGYHVFLPYGQCTANEFENKGELKNNPIHAAVIELNNLKKSIVCSTKILQSNQITPVAVGDILSGKVIRVEEKYALVILANNARAKLSIKDASWQHINSMEEVVTLGEHYDFMVLECNTDFSRVTVGLKQLQTSPLDAKFDSLKIGDEVEGEVVKIMPVGALIKLTNGLTALAVTRENSDRANVATHHIYKLHTQVSGYISRLDSETHRINIITAKKPSQN